MMSLCKEKQKSRQSIQWRMTRSSFPNFGNLKLCSHALESIASALGHSCTTSHKLFIQSNFWNVNEENIFKSEYIISSLITSGRCFQAMKQTPCQTFSWSMLSQRGLKQNPFLHPHITIPCKWRDPGIWPNRANSSCLRRSINLGVFGLIVPSLSIFSWSCSRTKTASLYHLKHS